ncbi:MAG: stage 0 sporulation protein [Thermodesulfovibrionia bacterium]|nr:stage 0 sporulation protein [Thermodesulfovibrionia bacterium]
MPDVVGIRFKQCGKIYNFEVNGINTEPGTQVVVESDMGMSLGVVVVGKHGIENPEKQLKKILRIATDEDLETDKNNSSLKEEAKAFCLEKVKSRNLPMKIVGTEATLDKKRLIFYFTADGRIDFRELVRDLASKFKTRIEMRQIGVRDEVKHLGAMGICGREVCCKTFLTSFEPISIRMAKKQELVLNPGKLSGICGRLMCCLGYEIESPEKKEKEDTICEDTEDKTIVVTDDIIQEESTVGTVPSYADASQSTKPEKSSQNVPQSQPQRKHKDKKSGEKERDRHKQEKKDKGTPFSRRRKFFKKKKRRQQ